MTLEGRDGFRHLVDLRGEIIDDDYEGPARYVDEEGRRVLVAAYLDPHSAAIVRSLIDLRKAAAETRE